MLKFKVKRGKVKIKILKFINQIEKVWYFYKKQKKMIEDIQLYR